MRSAFCSARGEEAGLATPARSRGSVGSSSQAGCAARSSLGRHSPRLSGTSPPFRRRMADSSSLLHGRGSLSTNICATLSPHSTILLWVYCWPRVLPLQLLVRRPVELAPVAEL